MQSKLRLLSSADVAILGERHYLFDRAAAVANVVSVPTQRISKRLFDVVRRIRSQFSGNEGQSLGDIEALFAEPHDRKLVAQLLAAGYLEDVVTPDPVDAGLGAAVSAQSNDQKLLGAQIEHFRNKGLDHFFKRASFFNLPEQIEDAEAEVGIVGLPISSIPVSNGTVSGPSRLRQDSQRAGFWFDIWKDGVYTEIGCDGGTPRLMCKNVRLKDFSDIGQHARTIRELFAEVSEFVEQRLRPNQIRPVFVGGDHAITFPIVDAYLKNHPDLTLIHLDAHNDLFYTEHIEYNHAGPIHGLLLHSGLRKVMSFGVRTTGDTRVGPYLRLASDPSLKERLRLYSIASTRRWLSRPQDFLEHLRAQVGSNGPCYLTIDLDVLSDTAIGGQLSTPAGAGLEWHELFEFVDLVMGECDVIGCDVVEFSPGHSTNEDREPCVLLMQLIDGLARSAMRAGAGSEPTDTSCESVVAEPAVPTTKVIELPVTQAAQQQAQGFGSPVDRRSIDELCYAQFLDEYALPGRPVVLTGLGDSWPAMSQWTLDYFIDKAATDELAEFGVFTKPADVGPVRAVNSRLRDTLNLMKRRLKANLGTKGERYYLVDWHFHHAHPEIFDDYRVPPFFNMDLSEQVGVASNLMKWIYIGESGTGSPTHIDTINSSAWLMLVQGRKQWRMVSPAALDALSSAGEPLNLFEPNPHRFPDLADAQLYETIQLPGEVLWTPPLCLHAVRNLEFSIAVTENYVDLSNLVEVFDATLGATATPKPQPVVTDALAVLMRQGFENLRKCGLTDAAPLLSARLDDSLMARQALADGRKQSIELALNELRRWSA
jgi:arginase family enzyme